MAHMHSQGPWGLSPPGSVSSVVGASPSRSQSPQPGKGRVGFCLRPVVELGISSEAPGFEAQELG